MTTQRRTKNCGNCGNLFVEKLKDSSAQWEKREFCGIGCNNSNARRTSSIFERLARFQIKGEGCWGWSGGTDGKGYGALSARSPDKSPEKAHRVSYEYAFGHIPDGMLVCHTCDNPPCTNPEHLFLGTQKDNMTDCASKGRLNSLSLAHLRPGKKGFLGAAPKKEPSNGSWSK